MNAITDHKENTPGKPCNRTETLNFDESADGHRGGVRMEAKFLTISPCKGTEPFDLQINRSGGTAEGTLPPRTSAVLVRLTLRISLSDGSIAMT